MFKNIKISKKIIEKLPILFRHIERKLSLAKKITLRDRALRVILDSMNKNLIKISTSDRELATKSQNINRLEL